MQVMRIPFIFMQAHRWRNTDSVITDLGTNVHMTPPSFLPRPDRVAAENAVALSVPTYYGDWAAVVNRKLQQHSHALHPDKAILQQKWQLVLIMVVFRLWVGKRRPFVAFDFMDLILTNLIMTAYFGTFTQKLTLPFSSIEGARNFFADNNNAVLGTNAPRPSWIAYRKFPIQQVREFPNRRQLASAVSRNRLIAALGLGYRDASELWIGFGRKTSLLPFRLADPGSYKLAFSAKKFTRKETVTLG